MIIGAWLNVSCSSLQGCLPVDSFVSGGIAATGGSGLVTLFVYDTNQKVIDPITKKVVLRSDFEKSRKTAAGVLGGILLLDFAASVVKHWELSVTVEKELQPHAGSGRETLGDAMLYSTQSLIPGWSALYLNRSYWLGFLMTVLEGGALANYMPWNPAPTKAAEDPEEILTSLVAIRISRDDPVITLVQINRLQDNVIHPTNGQTISKDQYTRNKTNAALALGATLLLDYVVSTLVVHKPKEAEKTTYQFHLNLRPLTLMQAHNSRSRFRAGLVARWDFVY